MFKRFIRFVKNLFRKSKNVIVKKPKIIISKPSYENDETRRIAFIVGHNSKRQGADNYLGESEFYYYRRIFRKLVNKLNEINNKNFYMIIERPTIRSYSRQVKSVINECMKNDIREAFCGHFNDSDNPRSNGLEILHTKKISEKSLERGKIIARTLSEKSKSRLRRDSGMFKINSRHNGYGMINGLESNFIDTLLLEPCFAKDKSAGKFFFDYEDMYINALAESILTTF